MASMASSSTKSVLLPPLKTSLFRANLNANSFTITKINVLDRLVEQPFMYVPKSPISTLPLFDPLGSLADVTGIMVRPMLQTLGEIEVYCPHRRGDQGQGLPADEYLCNNAEFQHNLSLFTNTPCLQFDVCFASYSLLIG
jgi:hypothetical protein